jgi:heavy metal sensor kinase
MAVGMVALGWLALTGMKHSIRATVDEQLAERLSVVREVIVQNAASDETLREALGKNSRLETEETLLAVKDDRGESIYQSRWLTTHPFPEPQTPASSGHGVNVRMGRMPLRVMTVSVAVNGHVYRVLAAVEMDDFYAAIGRFRRVLLIAIPVLLFAASLAGYFMSRRALAPVDQITKAASDINLHNLSARVEVPNSGDELHRLAETFNAMLDRIETSLKRITQFTADASHELRTPIAVMRTRAELALRRARTESEYQDTIKQLHDELVRTSDLVERLMLLARTDSGVNLLRYARVDLTLLARDAVAQLDPLLQNRRLSIETKVDEGLWADGDAQFLRQLFVILLDNAIKYTPDSGKVTIGVSANGEVAQFTVSDTGIGIESADLENVFERFYRADKARSRESGGAGLGLAIGRWIAEAHGGSISVESKPGIGSEFSVLLPLQKAVQRCRR